MLGHLGEVAIVLNFAYTELERSRYVTFATEAVIDSTKFVNKLALPQNNGATIAALIEQLKKFNEGFDFISSNGNLKPTFLQKYSKLASWWYANFSSSTADKQTAYGFAATAVCLVIFLTFCELASEHWPKSFTAVDVLLDCLSVFLSMALIRSFWILVLYPRVAWLKPILYTFICALVGAVLGFLCTGRGNDVSRDDFVSAVSWVSFAVLIALTAAPMFMVLLGRHMSRVAEKMASDIRAKSELYENYSKMIIDAATTGSVSRDGE